MSTTATRPPTTHPVVEAITRCQEILSAVASEPVWQLGTAAAADLVLRGPQLASQVTELNLRVLAHAHDLQVGTDHGATSTANWLSHHTRTTRAGTHRDIRTAQCLTTHDLTRSKLAEGSLRVDQATVILDALTALPTDLVDDTLRLEAETYLITQAAVYDAKTLRILGKKVLDVIAPHLGEAHEARTLAKEEADARKATRFSMRSDGHGKSHGRFTLPDAVAAMLSQALNAIAAPKHQTAIATQAAKATRTGVFGEPLDDEPDTRAGTSAGADAQVGGERPVRLDSDERLGRAFAEYIENYPTDALPMAGGVNATVVVHIDYTQLLAEHGVAHLDTGEHITAATARRWACEAGIIPAVLGGASLPLDLGRELRLYTKAQRIAMAIRDRGCTTIGCDHPPAMCHAHHDCEWAHGGPTDIDKGRLLCPNHHQMIHDPTYTTTHHPGHTVSFHRRT